MVIQRSQQWITRRLPWTSCKTSLRKKSSFYISTPIFYVNAEPHVGHVYTACLADARHRWEKMKGRESVFVTGTDEHGMKIYQAATKAGLAPLDFCDHVSSKFKDLFDSCDISYTHFVRTTDARHKETVLEFWEKLRSSGSIYKGAYEGWYCVADEAFVSPLQVEERRASDGRLVRVSKESGRPVEWTKEENYKFRLSHFKDDLIAWTKGDVVRPASMTRVLDRWLADLQDVSVSREAARHTWGIPVPNDPAQTIYVWLDALCNYLTVARHQSSPIWPPDYHVVGKDILKFHAIYWPAFLLAAELPLPSSIFCHSHWTVDDVKMSKSLGNVVDPVECIKTYSTDGLRYFLLKEGVPHNDGNYTDAKMVRLLNADLCNTLGNLLSRCTGLKINPDQVYPVPDPGLLTHNDAKWMEKLYQLPALVDEEFCALNFYRGLDLIMARLHETNALLQQRQIWRLAGPGRDGLVSAALENVRVCGLLLQPVLPRLACTLLDWLGVPHTQRQYTHALSQAQFLPAKIDSAGVLFPRLKLG